MTQHQPRIPNAIDVHVGTKAKLRRKELSLSQTEIGKTLGVTFQQVQKYERGANRIGASRLWALSQALDVPISYFYEGLTGHDTQPIDPSITEFIGSTFGLNIVQACSKISEPQKAPLLAMIRSL